MINSRRKKSFEQGFQQCDQLQLPHNGKVLKKALAMMSISYSVSIKGLNHGVRQLVWSGFGNRI
jgi:hypothetical protein